ncbi:MAG TPA: cyclic nucleotide-binding domain-containing protein [Gemmatimonadota bacterium]|nr:cyclic nucleotide-binding domain-containing protein [Gemmatimonadota bacterium]
MSLWSRLSSILQGHSRTERVRLVAMGALFFLVVGAVGILRPVKNAFALDGLADTDFYKVYFVSAVVVLFVPAYNRLAARFDWKVLIPGLAVFFALDLVLFRIFYHDGSATFGMLFYGWYDLFAAALVTQFFTATQLFFDASQAKSAYPLIIAGGSIGATAGGAVTGFLATRIGTPQLLLVAAGVIAIFGFALPIVWSGSGLPMHEARDPAADEKLSLGEFRRVFSNRHVQLLAAMVLLTVLVKQVVDYEFNTVTLQAFGTRDAVTAFQGKFNAATQWLPILVLVSLRPLLPRIGVGLAVFLLPITMLLTSGGLILFWGLWAAVAAKGAETTFRYSAERTGREILYVPVPEEIKIKAKLYIDIAVEKGLGKVSSALLIMGLLAVVGYRRIPLVAMGLAVVWLGVAVAVRREYLRSLVEAVRGRFASLDGLFASLTDASTAPVVREALLSGEPLQVAFALDLVSRGAPEDVERFAGALGELLDHPSAEIRARALELLAGRPSAVDPAAAHRLLADPSLEVRRTAAGILARGAGPGAEELVDELLSSAEARTRVAALSWLSETTRSADGDGRVAAGGEVPPPPGPGLERETAVRLGRRHLARIRNGSGGDGAGGKRLERALVATVLAGEVDAAQLLAPLLDDADPVVRAAALRAAGRSGTAELLRRVADALSDPEVRAAARDTLAEAGDRAVPVLAARLADESVPALVRRHLPSALARIPTPASFGVLLASYAAPETDQLLDHRTLKALNKLRAREPGLEVDEETVLACLDREIEAIRRYGGAAARLEPELKGERGRLLVRALREARSGRRECAFRCLALVHPPEVIHRCYLALSTGDRRARGNAQELLEQTVGHVLFRRLGSAVEGAREAARGLPGRAAPASGDGGGRDARDVAAELSRLAADKDRWVARCARAALAERSAEAAERDGAEAAGRGSAEAGHGARPGGAGEIGDAAGPGGATEREGDVDAIEKVFLLQRVDILREARTSELAMLAAVSREVDADEGRELLRRGEPPDGLYVIVRGGVTLDGAGEEIVLRDGSAFGTWALIDDSPSLVDARAREPTRLLRVGRTEFQDVLFDHPELGIDLLQGLARRVRALARA